MGKTAILRTLYIVYRLWPLWLFVGCTTYIQLRGKVTLKL
jgi:hypothetical protein